MSLVGSGEPSQMRTLVNVEFGGGEELGSLLTWSQAMNLLACTLRPSLACPYHRIALVSPEDPQVFSVLEFPRGVDELVSLSWSPLQLPNGLLAVTRQGAGYLWMQPATLDSGAMAAATVDNWAGELAFQGSANPVVVKWLVSPTSYTWPPMCVYSRTDNFELPFANPSATAGMFHWARPGAMCAALVSSSGLLQVFFRQIGGKWGGPVAVQLDIGTEMAVGGDLVTGQCCSLSVALLLPHQATKALSVLIFAVTGDPTNLSAAGQAIEPLQAVLQGTISPPAGQAILSVHFCPKSAGEQVVVVQRNELSQRLYISRYNMSPQPGGPCTCTLNVEVSGGLGGAAPLACMGHDALFLMAAAQGGPVLVLTDRNHKEYKVTLDCELKAIAPSPNSEAWACIWVPRGGPATSASLRILGLPSPFCPIVSDIVHHFYYRIGWSMVTGSHGWDIGAMVRQMAAGPPMAKLERPHQLVSEVLKLADSALHAQPLSHRSYFANNYLRLKLPLLLCVAQDAVAQAVYQDLWLRGIVNVMDPLFKMLTSQTPHGLVASPNLKEYGMCLTGYINWAEKAALYFLRCVHLYAKLKSEAGNDPKKLELADTVPCARLLHDTHFANAFSSLLLMGVLTEKSTLRIQVHNIQRRLEQVRNLAVKKKLAAMDEKKHDDIAGTLDTTNAVLASHTGDYQVHYGRTAVHLDWTVLSWFFGGATGPPPFDPTSLTPEMARKTQETVRMFHELKLGEATLEDLTREAATLGLRRGLDRDRAAPPNAWGMAPGQATTVPGGPSTPPLSEGSAGRRRGVGPPPQLPRDDLGPLLSACLGAAEEEAVRSRKRRRWVSQHDAALGRCRPSDAERGLGTPDILAGATLVPQLPPTHASVDGLCYTAELTPMPAAEVGTLPRLVRKGYYVACPVTFSPWRRIRGPAGRA